VSRCTSTRPWKCCRRVFHGNRSSRDVKAFLRAEASTFGTQKEIRNCPSACHPKKTIPLQVRRQPLERTTQGFVIVQRYGEMRVIDHHTEAVDELDVRGILAFAERILPRVSDLWVQASLDYKQRLQQLFFPEGIAYDGNRFNRTTATAPFFNYLAPSESADEKR
jgi:hypothetical protein